MGCQTTREDVTIPESKFQLVLSEKEYLQHLIQCILNEGSYCLVLNRRVFEQISNELTAQPWPYQDKANLARLIEEYFRFTVQLIYKTNSQSLSYFFPKRKEVKSKYLLENIGKQFGEEVNTIFNIVQQKNRGILETLKRYNNLDSLYFSLGVESQQKKERIIATTDSISQIASECEQGYFYLSLILVKGCMELEGKRITPIEINKKLQQTLDFINLATMNTPQTLNSSHLMLIYHEIRSELYNRFESKKYVEYKYREINLTGTDSERQSYFEESIMKIVEEAKKQFQYFQRMIFNVIKLHSCRNFKVNFKLKYRSDKEQLQRVKQKILMKQSNNFKKDSTLNYKSIAELRTQQAIQGQVIMNKILAQHDTITLEISDLLRGRALFPNIQLLIKAVEELVVKIDDRKQKGDDVQLIEIDNRLLKSLSDIVIKIRIRSTITEFQMSLAPVKAGQTDSFKNNIYHKVYDLSRSKTRSSISMLFNWHEKLTISYIKFVAKVIKHKKIQNSNENMVIFKQLCKDPLVESIIKDSIKQSKDKIALKVDIISILLKNKVLDEKKAALFKSTSVDRSVDFFLELGKTFIGIELLEKQIANQANGVSAAKKKHNQLLTKLKQMRSSYLTE